MARIRRSKLPQTQWESHKSAIRKLYLEEKRSLEGENGVIEIMDFRGFHASKPQYESQFKRWGFRKKLTRETWHTIGHIVERRKTAGLTSQVYLFGEKIANEKVKKDTARHKICGTDSQNCDSDILPENVTIQAIPIGRSDEAKNLNEYRDLSSPEDESPDEVKDSELDDLSVSIYSASDNPPALSPSLLDFSSLISRFSTPSFDLNTELISISPSDAMSQDGWELVQNYAYEAMPSNTLKLFEGLQSPLLEKLRIICDSGSGTVNLKARDSSVGRTMPLLPWRAQCDLQTKSYDIVLFRQIMFLLMNNFAGSDYAPFEALFQQLKDFSLSQLEDILNAIPLPYSTALQQSILTIAIKSGIPAIVNILLNRKLDVDKMVCRFAGISYTPLGLACKFRRMEIIKLLVDFGVDVNQQDHHTAYTAMRHLLGLEYGSSSDKNELHPVTCDILRLLLMEGATIDWNELENPHFWTNTPILDVYIRYSKTPVCFKQAYQLDRPMSHVTRLIDHLRATRAINVMLGPDFKAGGHLDPGIEARCIDALRVASHQGNMSLVDFFLTRGFQPNVWCLCEAVRGDRMAVIQRFVNAGLSLDLVWSSSYDRLDLVRPYAGRVPEDVDVLLQGDNVIRYRTSTPFAEAIRWQHDTMIRLFREGGIFDTITESRRFSAALIAAAEVGDTKMVYYLLEKAIGHTELFIPELSTAISLATLGNHVAIVEALMLAGIKPVPTSMIAAIVVRNAKLVRLFLDAATAVDFSGIIWFAIRWGDTATIQELIIAGAAVNEVGWHLGFIEPATSPKDPVRTPLGEAIHHKNAAVIQLLLKNGANVSMKIRNQISGSNGLSPLAVAVQLADRNLVNQLLELGADPHDPVALLASVSGGLLLTDTLLTAFMKRYPEGKKHFSSKALRYAIRTGNVAGVELLAEYTDPNDTEQRREELDEIGPRKGRSLEYLPSPLGEAIITGNTRILKALLDNHGDPNHTVATHLSSPHTGRWTAILQAIATEELKIVKLMRNAGAQVNCEAELGITRTPLQLAVELGHCDIVQYLLEEGADVNALPCIWEGRTALQLAAMTGYVGIAELLIEHGADVNAPGSKYQGRTAFEGAAEHGRMDMLLLLHHKGVDIVSDGGEQVRRALEFAETNGQLAAKSLVERLAEAARMNAIIAI